MHNHVSDNGIPAILPFRVFLFLTLLIPLIHLYMPLTYAESSGDVIVAGMPSNFPPYYMIDENTGEPAGFGIEVIESLAEQSGLKVKYKIYKTWPEVHNALKEGSIDIIPNMGITTERMTFADFTMPLETLQIMIYVRNTTMDIRGIEDLTGREVAVVKANKGKLIMEEKGLSRLQVYISVEQALLALLSGKADALIFPDTVTDYFVHELGLGPKVKAVGKPLLEIKRAIGVRKDLPALLKRLDADLNDFALSPEYKEIYTRWHTPPEAYWNVKRVVILTGPVIFAIFALLLFWRYTSVMRLNRALEEAVRESEVVKHELNKEIAEHEKDKNILKLRTEELSRKVDEVERLNKIFVGREIRMNELKKEIEDLKRNSV